MDEEKAQEALVRRDEGTTPAEVVKAPIATPNTFLDMAILKGDPSEVVGAFIDTIEAARKGAIRLTNPSDWLLFRFVDKQNQGKESITGYLQDKGCERVVKLYGISVFDVSEPRKIQGSKSSEYTFEQTASGYCARTGERVEKVIGSRSRADDMARNWVKDGKSEDQIEILLKKSTRANLDGNIIRSLTGLSSVPVEELSAAWAGTHKSVNDCARGRGWSGKGPIETPQAAPADVGSGVDDLDAPPCPKCSGPMKVIPGGVAKSGKYKGRPYASFFACEKGRDCKGGTMNREKAEAYWAENATEDNDEGPFD